MDSSQTTVLLDVLNRLDNDKQGSFTPDVYCLELCTYELESFWEQVPEENQDDIRYMYARIKEVLDKFVSGQRLQAKYLCGVALGEYKAMQEFYVTSRPKDFELKYWTNLSQEQKIKCLQKLKSSNQSKNKNVQVEQDNPSINTPPKKEQPKHVLKIYVNGQGMTKNSSNERPSRQRTPSPNEKQNFRERSSAPLTDSSSNENISKAKPYKDITTKTHESGSPRSINKRLVKEGNQEFGDRDLESWSNSTVSGEQTKDPNKSDGKRNETTTNTKEKTSSLHASSTKEEIAHRFFEVYNNCHRPLYDRIVQGGVKQQLAFESLLSILKIIADVCQTFSNDQISSMNKYLIKIGDGSSTDKVQDPDLFLLFEFRRLNARLSLETLIQKTLERCKKDLKGIQYDRYNKETKQMFNDFLHASIEVVWYMAIQERPCVLVFDAMRGTDPTHLFHGSTDTFKRFQQVVWPAVMSDQHRNVLEKGIAIFMR